MATIRKRGDSICRRIYFNGKHHWQLAGDREKDAKRIKADIAKGIYEGTYRQTENITFKTHANEWLDLKKVEVRPGTYCSYRTCATVPLSPSATRSSRR